MEDSVDENELKPLFEPRLIRLLKDRPRLVDRGFREEFLEQLEENVRERRKPDTVAEEMAKNLMRRFEDAGGSVVKNRARSALETANEGPLEKL